MSELRTLSCQEVDAVSGGILNFVAAGAILQGNFSNTQQGQVNLSGVNFIANQGGGQLAQTGQSNIVSAS